MHYIKPVFAILFSDCLLKLIEGWFHETHFWPMSPFYTPENDRKPKVFWCFQGDKMRTLARNGLSLFISLYNINVTKVMFWVRI